MKRSDPTHLLLIAVPLNMDANPAAESYDIQGAMAQAMKAILPMVSLGTLGLLCGEIEVSVTPSVREETAA